MRILFISTLCPAHLQTYVHGGFKRMGMFIDAIKEIGQLDMLFYVYPEVDRSRGALLEMERSMSRYWDADLRLFLCRKVVPGNGPGRWALYGRGIFSFFKQGVFVAASGIEQVTSFEACLERKPDVIFAHYLGSMCPPLLSRKPLPPIVFDLDNVDHMALLRGTTQSKVKGVLRYARLPALLWGERRAIQLASRTFVCSEGDRRYLEAGWRLPGVVTVPNAVRIPELKPVTPEPTLLFLGWYSYRPNVAAAEFLIERVWPSVRRSVANSRLIIAGHPADRVRGYGAGIPGVEFTGLVEDLEALYARSRVVCAPILSGTGTRVKIIEAAAYGKPIVATRIGAEGLDLRDSHEILLRDEPEPFAEACIALLRDERLCESFGSAARRVAVERYDRAQIVRLVQRYVKEAAAERGSASPAVAAAAGR